VSQLGGGLGLSPQRLRAHKALESKRLAPCEPVIHGPAQLVGEHGERLGFAVFLCEFSKLRFPRRTLPDTEHGGFSKGPAQMDVPALLARGASPFPPRLFGALDQPTIRDEILHARKAGDVLDLIEDDQR
jgi:hypothetical protein